MSQRGEPEKMVYGREASGQVFRVGGVRSIAQTRSRVRGCLTDMHFVLTCNTGHVRRPLCSARPTYRDSIPGIALSRQSKD